MRAPLLLVLLATGCLTRVALPAAPAPDAPMAQRKQALSDFTGTRTQDAILVAQLKDPVKSEPYLLLGNGLRVEDPRDLLPLVDPDSQTAADANAFEIAQSRSSVFAGGAIAAPLLGIGALIGGFVVPALRGGKVSSADGVPFIIGAAATSFTGLAFALVAVVFRGVSSGEKDKAFAAYAADLAHHLGLDP